MYFQKTPVESKPPENMMRTVGLSMELSSEDKKEGGGSDPPPLTRPVKFQIVLPVSLDAVGWPTVTLSPETTGVPAAKLGFPGTTLGTTVAKVVLS